jgi:hypothetical protein
MFPKEDSDVKRAFVAVAVLVLATASAVAASGGKHYGAPFGDAKTITLADATASAEKLATTPVRIRGKVLDVCQREGCWLVLSDGEREMRIHMKDHAFAVPKDIGGKMVVVEGLVEQKVLTEAQARHFAEESNGKVDPATIKGDQTTYRMMATGVLVEE